ncbi:MAG: Fe-S cluster assembly protein SufD [candidate division Zixibacteria bacterium]|nr:Fe-S cluster assembly protein SufD [candidate division Zixibacteria bacterium]
MSTLTLANKNKRFRGQNQFEPEALYSLRKESWNCFNDLDMPHRANHLWRYTDPKVLLANNPSELMKITPSLPDQTEYNLISLDEAFSGYGYNRSDYMTFAKLTPALEKSGVIFKDLLSATRENEDIVGKYLGNLIGSDFGKFEAMNLALWNTGLFLYVPDNINIELPIRLQRHPSGPNTFHRLLVVVGNNSKVTLIDDYSGECRKEEAQINSVVEIFAGDSSSVKYLNTQRYSSKCNSYITQRTRINKDAKSVSVFAGLGGNVSKTNAGTVLDGPGANSQLYGIVFGDDNQHFDYHIVHHHTSSNSYSNIDFKTVLKDNANSASTGLIRVEEDALNCEAFQVNRNLLLNEGAKAESIPELEILCDQVQCSHGATISPIDKEMLFYLMSRGVAYKDAVNIITLGFIEPTIKNFPGELETLTRELITGKMEG